MSHSAASSYTPTFHNTTVDKPSRGTIDIEATKVKKGQLIFWHDDKINEIIDMLVEGSEETRAHAKANSEANRHFCVVMGDPEVNKDGTLVRIPLLHCTKSTFSRHRRKIYRPLPYPKEPNMYKSYTERAPLEVRPESSSTELHSQTYVIPYEIFYAVREVKEDFNVCDFVLYCYWEAERLIQQHARSSTGSG